MSDEKPIHCPLCGVYLGDERDDWSELLTEEERNQPKTFNTAQTIIIRKDLSKP